ncbi:MAG: hypothetical protein A3K03_04285 [Bdellovibrionales bacterium RIFOXYD1_FULL_44_7]|nr:MAG: hypothetical protein A3K03_04285 [Bdellovibrionales bacterium RIFOXYD1_FULL_44_7]
MKSDSNSWKKLLSVLIFFTFLFFFVNYLFIPLGSDARVMISGGHLGATQYGGGLSGMVKSWEMKPFGNRIIFGVLHNIATVFVSYDNKAAFEFVVRFFYVSFALISSFFLARGISLSFGSSFYLSFFFLGLVFMGSPHLNNIQAEESAIIFSLLAAALLLNNRSWSSILCGVVLFFVLAIKIVTIFYVLCVLVFAAALIFEKKLRLKQLGLTLSSFVLTSIIVTALLSLLYPQEFIDITNTRMFQGSAGFELDKKVIFALYRYHALFFENMLANHPLHIGGIVASAMAMVLSAIKRKPFYAVLVFICYLFGLSGVVFQNKAFGYHYTFLVLPFIFSVWVVFHLSKEFFSRDKMYFLSAGIVGVLCLVFFSSLPRLVRIFFLAVAPFSIATILVFILSRFLRIDLRKGLKLVTHVCCIVGLIGGFLLSSIHFTYLTFIAPQRAIADTVRLKWYGGLKEHLDLTKVERESAKCAKKYVQSSSDPILYLDFGTVGYYLGNPSASRFQYPMPLTRGENNARVQALPIYQDTLKQALSYNGNYVIDDNWIIVDRHQGLDEMLKKNFSEHHCGTWKIYVRKVSNAEAN